MRFPSAVTFGGKSAAESSRIGGRAFIRLACWMLLIAGGFGPRAWAQSPRDLPEPGPVIADTSYGAVDYGLFLLDLDSAAVSLDAIRDSVLFVNMWASWCSPCVAELPGINTLRERLADHPVAFLMISVDDEVEDVRRFLQEHEARPAVYLRGWDRSVKTFRGIVIPRTYIVAKGGRIAYRHVGAAQWDSDAIIDYLIRLSEE